MSSKFIVDDGPIHDDYTHVFDGRIGKVYKACLAIDEKELIPPSPYEIVLEEMEYVLSKINIDESTRARAFSAIQVLKKERGRNYDNANDINIEDLLPRAWRFVRKYKLSAAIVFYEQLADMIQRKNIGGTCPQGRSTRLLNMYTVHMHMGSKDPVYKQCMK